MENKTEIILNLLIEVEKKASKLYTVFSEYYENNSDFWWQLSMEETNHASLLRTIKDSFYPAGLIPDNIFNLEPKILSDDIQKINKIEKKYRLNKPDYEEAIEDALALENLAGEFFYQELMTNKKINNNMLKIFQNINTETLNHKDRINELKNQIKNN